MRHSSIDFLRGFIMILMALDHASAMVARVHFTEVWGWEFNDYPSVLWWATRFASHLCAPGFFFLMGMSMYLFAENRRQKNWTGAAIRNYFMRRGFFIIVLMVFLELPAWGLSEFFSDHSVIVGGSPFPGAAEGFFFPTTVLFGLGMGMILASFLWNLPRWGLLLFTVASFLLSGFYVGSLSPEDAFPAWSVLLLVPGRAEGLMTIYPVIPWLGIVTLGLYWGRLLQEKPDRFQTYTLGTAFIFLVAFLACRLIGIGNFQATEFHDLVSFFSFVKYPPSAVFFFFTMGINLLLLLLFSRFASAAWLRPVGLFGQTAMFFYLLHLHLYAWLGAAFPSGSTWWQMCLIWLFGLVILYFVCRRYLSFKQAKPASSWWRMI